MGLRPRTAALGAATFSSFFLLSPCSSRAAIVGFGDFSGFGVNVADGGAAPTVSDNAILLTNQASGESRSVFYNARQNVAAFNASFTYQTTGSPSGASGFGAAFVIQNAAGGARTVAAPSVSGIGTSFGYSDFYGTFQSSAAVSLERNSLSAGSSSTALYANGNVGGGSTATGPVNLFSGNPIRVSVAYTGALLTERLVDTVSGATFSQSYLVNIPSVVGSNLAYVGRDGGERDRRQPGVLRLPVRRSPRAGHGVGGGPAAVAAGGAATPPPRGGVGGLGVPDP